MLTKQNFRRLMMVAAFPVLVILILELLVNTPLIVLKLRGAARECPWSEVLYNPVADLTHDRDMRTMQKTFRLLDYDPTWEIEKVGTASRAFWIKREGRMYGGQALLAELLAEHNEAARLAGRQLVQEGDVVLDCGAHVGVFSSKALELGASLVVAIEPDIVNLECLRRNFAEEIAQGRVIVYPKGVWHSEETLTLHESHLNSGMNSVVLNRDGKSTSIPVTMLDKIVSDLGLQRVDLIKMDIEGAEREALRGGRGVLAKSRPRLMLDSYHRADDMQAFREELRAFTYRVLGCRPCDENPRFFVPRVTLWVSK